MARSAKLTKIVLEPGQIWKTNQGYIEIVELGKTLVHYRRTLKPHQRAVPIRVAPMTTLTEMISRGEGHLMRGSREPSSRPAHA